MEKYSVLIKDGNSEFLHDDLNKLTANKVWGTSCSRLLINNSVGFVKLYKDNVKVAQRVYGKGR